MVPCRLAIVRLLVYYCYRENHICGPGAVMWLPEGVRRASVPIDTPSTEWVCIYGTLKLSLNSMQNVQMQVQRCESMLTGTYRVHIYPQDCLLAILLRNLPRNIIVLRSTWMEILRGNNQVCVFNPAPVGPQPLWTLCLTLSSPVFSVLWTAYLLRSKYGVRNVEI